MELYRVLLADDEEEIRQGISRKEYALAITESILLVFLIAMLFYSRLWMMAVFFPLGMKNYERMIRQAEE